MSKTATRTKKVHVEKGVFYILIALLSGGTVTVSDNKEDKYRIYTTIDDSQAPIQKRALELFLHYKGLKVLKKVAGDRAIFTLDKATQNIAKADKLKAIGDMLYTV